MSDEIMRSFFISNTDKFSVLEIILSLFMPFLLSFIISFTYKKTITGQNYSVEFARSLFLFSVVTSFTTLIIGGNIARAFGLVGALSLIRFRTVLKSPMETMYIFWSLATGMACGTGLYMAAVIFTLITTAFLFFLTYINYGADKDIKCIVKVYDQIENEYELQKNLSQEFSRLTKSYQHINTVINSSSNKIGLVYELALTKDEAMINHTRKIQSAIGADVEIKFYSQEEALFI
jgi:hypothetical protein